MKKFFLTMVAVLCVATAASAQSGIKQAFGIDSNARCAAGIHIGTGAQIMGEYFYGKDVYIDARLGYDWTQGFGVTALHMWNPKDWNWTPNLGWWFVDAGAGAYVGVNHGVSFGVAASAKFGILFKNVPIRLAVDITPRLGFYSYGGYFGFDRTSIFNGGLQVTYCF